MSPKLIPNYDKDAKEKLLHESSKHDEAHT